MFYTDFCQPERDQNDISFSLYISVYGYEFSRFQKLNVVKVSHIKTNALVIICRRKMLKTKDYLGN